MRISYQQLEGEINQSLLKVEQDFLQIKALPKSQLVQKPSKDAWSAMECLEHLNLTAQLYHPRIKQAIQQAKKVRKVDFFEKGRFGKKMTEGLLPDATGKLGSKMKTFKFFKPQVRPEDSERVLKDFENYLSEFKQLMADAQHLDWQKIRITSAIGPLLRFRLGDCYPFLLAHQQRHILQAIRASKKLATVA